LWSQEDDNPVDSEGCGNKEWKQVFIKKICTKFNEHSLLNAGK